MPPGMGGPPMGPPPAEAMRAEMTRDALIQQLRGQVSRGPAGATMPRAFVPPSETAGQKRPLV
jgi:hypothetical protein